MYFLAGHRNYSFVLTKASAVDKCNKAGDVYGKMLVLTFEDNEDAMMNRILSLINTKEEVIQIGTKRHPDRKGQYQSCNREIQCHDNEDLWIYL